MDRVTIYTVKDGLIAGTGEPAGVQWEDDFFGWQSEVPAAEANEDSLRPHTYKDRCSFSCILLLHSNAWFLMLFGLRALRLLRKLLAQLTPQAAQERGAQAPSARTAQAPRRPSKRRPRRLF